MKIAVGVLPRSLVASAGLLLAACAHDPAPRAPSADVASTTLLAVGQVTSTALPPCCNVPTPLDGTATGGDRDWRHIRRELAKTERGLGLQPLAKSCREGSPDAVAFVRMRWTSRSRDEDALILEAATATSPASFTQLQDRWRDDEPGGSGMLVARNKVAPDDARSRLARLEALGLRRFPAKVPGSWTSFHAPIWVLQSCLDGEYRMTYTGITPGELRIVQDKPSEFYRAIAQLLELAKLPAKR